MKKKMMSVVLAAAMVSAMVVPQYPQVQQMTNW